MADEDAATGDAAHHPLMIMPPELEDWVRLGAVSNWTTGNTNGVRRA